MGDYGIKVSEDGYSALTAGDINLILKTDFTLLKVKAQGTVDMSSGYAEITHSLGYTPQFMAFGLADGGGSDDYILPALNNYYWYPDSFVVGDWISAHSDTTKLYLSAGSAHGSAIISAYYYIFYEAA